MTNPIFERLHGALDDAGVRVKKKIDTRSVFQTGTELFRTPPVENEPAFRVAAQCHALFSSGLLHSDLFNHGKRNRFASRTPSRYGRNKNDSGNLVHLARVFSNVQLGMRYHDALNDIGRHVPEKYAVTFERNSWRKKAPDARGITGCPEALWGLHLFKDGQFVGRIGLNFHHEKGKVIVTFAEIKGAAGKKELIEQVRKELKINFGAFLMQQVKQALGDNVSYRGIIQKLDPEQSPHLYGSAFRQAKVMDLFS